MTIEEIKQQITELDNEINSNFRRSEELHTQLHQLMREEFDVALLTKFAYKLTGNRIVILAEAGALKALDPYLPDWHDQFEIADGVYLRVDDYEYSIMGNDVHKLAEFLTNVNTEEYLNIDVSELETRILRLKRELVECERLQAIYHGTNG